MTEERGYRYVAFAGSRVRIAYRGSRASKIVQFLYRDAEDCESDRLQARFAIVEQPASGVVVVRRDDRACYKGRSLAEAARTLQESASEALAAGSIRGVLFHAAAVRRGEHLLLFPGSTGAGKTTLTVQLIALGFQYLTDELSFVPDASLSVQALSRPLCIKASGRDVIPRGLATQEGWAALSGPAAMLLRPPAAGAAGDPTPAMLAGVVFPRFRPDAPVRLKRLTSAACGLRLMACLLNARNLPEHGFPAVSEMARRVPSYELVYGDSFKAARRLEALADLGNRPESNDAAGPAHPRPLA